MGLEQPKHAQSWCRISIPQANFFPTHDSKVSLWGPLQAMNSNLNLVSSIIILIIKHWNSQAAVMGLEQPKHAQSCYRKTIPQANFSPTRDSKVSLWGPIQAMNSNLNLVSPIIILIMRHWNSQAAVMGTEQPKHAQSWCRKLIPQANFPPTRDSKVSLSGPIHAMNSNLNLVSPIIILMMRHWNSQAAVMGTEQPKHAQSCYRKSIPQANFPPTRDSKVSLSGPIQAMNSNLNLVSPIIILMMRHWNSQANTGVLPFGLLYIMFALEPWLASKICDNKCTL
eukprot:scaffold8228_cov62-Cyclotella_meneghiniana.AAC.1